MEIKAENLKPGHAIKREGRVVEILTALKRFYKNGRAKMEITAKTAEGEKRSLTLKADTILEIL